jgi:hypothetical protein
MTKQQPIVALIEVGHQRLEGLRAGRVLDDYIVRLFRL